MSDLRLCEVATAAASISRVSLEKIVPDRSTVYAVFIQNTILEIIIIHTNIDEG